MANYIESAPMYYDQGIAGQIAYRDYQQKVAMTRDITDSITDNTDRSIAANAYNTEMINSRLVDMQIASTKAMYNNTRDMMGAFDSGLADVANQLQSGFSGVSNQLLSGFSNVSRQIGVMGANMSMAFAALNTSVQESAQAICDRLDTMNDIINNPSLTKTRELYRRASVNYDKGYFEEARDDLLDALASNKTDYISWFLLGKTYLFGAGEFSNVIDLDKAVEALKNTVKYITADARKQEEARSLAAEMCFFLGLAQQTKAMDSLHARNEADCRNYLEQADGSYSQSWDYSAKMLEARYNRARCKALLGDVQGAIADLETVVLQDRNYCVKVCADNDFSNIGEQFAALIKKLKEAVYIPAKKDYDHMNAMLSKLASLDGTTAVTVPATFTEECPYFNVLDYAEDFKRIIPIAEKDLADRKAAIARAEQEEREAKAKAKAKELGEYNRLRLEKNKLERERLTKYQACVSTGNFHTVALKVDGTVVAVGENDKGQCNVSGWRDIVAIAAGGYHTIGLKADGTVVAVGENDKGQCNVSGWRDIVAVAAGGYHTIGLKADGTVVAVGYNGYGECNVSDWQDIVTVAAWESHTVSLKADGTVVVAGDISIEWRDSGWRDIVAVAAGEKHIAGLKVDGTFIVVEDNNNGQCNVNGWRDIVAVAAGALHTIGLRADGTAVAVGSNKDGQCNVSGWQNIGPVSEDLKKDWLAKAETEKAEREAREAKERTEREAKAAREKAEREAREAEERQRQHWHAQGLCKHCGGQLGGLFTKKCKSCGKEN